jgi:prepilin-type N-terminal cleavage/methylation domain-containing protein
MNASPTPPAPRAGFTLLELLTVIVIIAILAALLFPVLGRTKDRVYDLAAKDLCEQVAVAWTEMCGQEGRFPSADLLEDVCGDKGDFRQNGGDLSFAMTPGATCVLSWWRPSTPHPKGDKRSFKVFLVGKGRQLTASDLRKPDPALVERWPADVRFDRSFPQKCLGVYASWAEREFAPALEKEISTNFEDDDLAPAETLSALETKWAGAIVRAAIDADADGKVTLPADLVAELGYDSVPGSAIAWVRSKDGKRLLTSW